MTDEIEEMVHTGATLNVERMIKELQEKAEREQALENCKKITLQRNRDRQKEQDRQMRLQRFWNALTSFMEDC